MKRLLVLLFAVFMIIPMAVSAGGYELVLVTDLGTIDDKSFNQGAWDGMKAYAEEHSISYKYYQPTEKSTVAYLTAIELAVKGGAKVVVAPGFLFEEAVFIAQKSYPNAHFILVDSIPGKDGEYFTAGNTVGVTYAEQEAGFLAGYAAVKEGMTKLGFMGGMAVPAVIRFGHGFVQGADYAANELGLKSVSIKYHYTGGFDANPEVQTLAASWYQSGVEVVFGCGGAVGNSVMAAAEATKNGKVIGVDIDQSVESTTVITSAMKSLSSSVYKLVEQHYAGSFPGGQNLVFDAANGGVMLPIKTSKFNSFGQSDYDKIYGILAKGGIKVDSNLEINADKLKTKVVSVQLVL